MRINEDNRKALPGNSKAQVRATVRALLENFLFPSVRLLFFFSFFFFPAFSILVMKNRGRCWLLLPNLDIGFCFVCALCFCSGSRSVLLWFFIQSPCFQCSSPCFFLVSRPPLFSRFFFLVFRPICPFFQAFLLLL